MIEANSTQPQEQAQHEQAPGQQREVKPAHDQTQSPAEPQPITAPKTPDQADVEAFKEAANLLAPNPSLDRAPANLNTALAQGEPNDPVIDSNVSETERYASNASTSYDAAQQSHDQIVVENGVEHPASYAAGQHLQTAEDAAKSAQGHSDTANLVQTDYNAGQTSQADATTATNEARLSASTDAREARVARDEIRALQSDPDSAPPIPEDTTPTGQQQTGTGQGPQPQTPTPTPTPEPVVANPENELKNAQVLMDQTVNRSEAIAYGASYEPSNAESVGGNTTDVLEEMSDFNRDVMVMGAEMENLGMATNNYIEQGGDPMDTTPYFQKMDNHVAHLANQADFDEMSENLWQAVDTRNSEERKALREDGKKVLFATLAAVGVLAAGPALAAGGLTAGAIASQGAGLAFNAVALGTNIAGHQGATAVQEEFVKLDEPGGLTDQTKIYNQAKMDAAYHGSGIPHAERTVEGANERLGLTGDVPGALANANEQVEKVGKNIGLLNILEKNSGGGWGDSDPNTSDKDDFERQVEKVRALGFDVDWDYDDDFGAMSDDDYELAEMTVSGGALTGPTSVYFKAYNESGKPRTIDPRYDEPKEDKSSDDDWTLYGGQGDTDMLW